METVEGANYPLWKVRAIEGGYKSQASHLSSEETKQKGKNDNQGNYQPHLSLWEIVEQMIPEVMPRHIKKRRRNSQHKGKNVSGWPNCDLLWEVGNTVDGL